MITVPQKVEEIIEQSPYYKEAIANDLLNLSSLARKIKPLIQKELVKEITEASILMALKRYAQKLKYIEFERIDHTKHLGDISLKSGLFERTYTNSSSFNHKLSLLIEEIKENKTAYFTFIKGVWQTTIIASNDLLHTIDSIFKEEKLETSYNNLTGLTVQLTNQHIEAPGVIAYVLQLMAWKGINLIEVVSTFDELSLILRDEDVEKAFSTLNRAKKSS